METRVLSFLYGPPGTGKSSLVAAMANYLNYHIYDLELTELDYNSELTQLLIATANRSMLVIEDIDCSIKLKNREEDSDSVENDGGKKKKQDDTTTPRRLHDSQVF